MEFRFVHAADLHLGSPFQGLGSTGSETVANHLREAPFLAFRRLVDLCIEHEAAFLLLAGDLFDEEECSVRDLLRCRDELQRLAATGIEVFIIHGNHDPLEGPRPVAWPENVHVFGSEAAVTLPVASLPEVTVTGISYRTARESRKLARQYVCPAEPGFHIAMLHADVGGDTSNSLYAACSVEQLRAAGFPYWALGHIHERRTFSTEPFIAYPGNIQGRNPRETGERGALLVTADTTTKEARAEFVSLQAVRWETLELSIAGLTTLDALENALLDRCESVAAACLPSSLVIRVRLTGRGPLHAELLREGASGDLVERLRSHQPMTPPFVWLESLQLACGSEIDFAARKAGDDLAAEVLRQADARVADAAWFEETLGGLCQHNRAKKALTALSADQLAQLLREAAERCVEALDEEA